MRLFTQSSPSESYKATMIFFCSFRAGVLITFIWHTAGDMQKFFPGGRAYYRAVCFFLPGGRAPSSRAGLQQAAGCNAARVRHLHRFFHDRNCCHRYYYCTKKSVIKQYFFYLLSSLRCSPSIMQQGCQHAPLRQNDRHSRQNDIPSE